MRSSARWHQVMAYYKAGEGLAATIPGVRALWPHPLSLGLPYRGRSGSFSFPLTCLRSRPNISAHNYRPWEWLATIGPGPSLKRGGRSVVKKNLALVCSLPLLLICASLQITAATQNPLALTHITVIDTTGGPAQPDMTIVTRGDRIVQVGKSTNVRVPPGSQVVDAAGKFLIPGLWD